METKTVKISAVNYKGICEFAGELQQEFGEPVSVDRALTFLLQKPKLSDLAGSWQMTEHQEKEMMKNLNEGWKKWRIKSV